MNLEQSGANSKATVEAHAFLGYCSDGEVVPGLTPIPFPKVVLQATCLFLCSKPSNGSTVHSELRPKSLQCLGRPTMVWPAVMTLFPLLSSSLLNWSPCWSSNARHTLTPSIFHSLLLLSDYIFSQKAPLAYLSPLDFCSKSPTC